jgi:hypothetical protein
MMDLRMARWGMANCDLIIVSCRDASLFNAQRLETNVILKSVIVE